MPDCNPAALRKISRNAKFTYSGKILPKIKNIPALFGHCNCLRPVSFPDLNRLQFLKFHCIRFCWWFCESASRTICHLRCTPVRYFISRIICLALKNICLHNRAACRFPLLICTDSGVFPVLPEKLQYCRKTRSSHKRDFSAACRLQIFAFIPPPPRCNHHSNYVFSNVQQLLQIRMRRIAAALVIRRKRRCHPVIRRNSIPVQIETMITEATGIEKTAFRHFGQFETSYCINCTVTVIISRLEPRCRPRFQQCRSKTPPHAFAAFSALILNLKRNGIYVGAFQRNAIICKTLFLRSDPSAVPQFGVCIRNRKPACSLILTASRPLYGPRERRSWIICKIKILPTSTVDSQIEWLKA